MEDKSDDNANKSRVKIKELINYFDFNNQNSSLIRKTETVKNSDKKQKNVKNMSPINKKAIIKEGGNINKNKINENKENINTSYNLYKKIIKQKLSEIKASAISFIDNIKMKMNQNYIYFSEFIYKWLKKKEKKLSKIIIDSENDDFYRNYFNENIYNKIKKLFDIHDYIFNSIKDQFTLLNIFLIEDQLISAKCPLEEFILKNSNFILNSWLLSNINMEEFNLSRFLENQDLSSLYKIYFSKKKEGILFKSINLKSENKKNYTSPKNISKDIFCKISKLKMNSISNSNLSKLYEKLLIEKDNNINEKGNKIKSISLLNLDLYSSLIEQLNKLSFPILEKFKVKKCIVPINCQIVFQNVISKTSNLQKLKIEFSRLTDKSLNELISNISKKNSMLEHTQCLSFKGNNLNSINFENLVNNNLIFKNLEELDLSDNNIYKFSTKNFRIFPKLLVFDLSNNNINNNILFEGIRKSKSKNIVSFIAFMCKNIFLYNVKENNKNYIKYLNENLINFNYKIKQINLGLLYNKHIKEEINKLIFSPVIRISLLKLDLSYCGLNDIAINNFLSNNFDLINLTNLNLSNNFITINFFKLCSVNNSEEYENKLIEKVSVIDLSYNKVECNSAKDIQNLYNFIFNHNYLRKIKFYYNELLNIFKNQEINKEYKDEISKVVNLCNNRVIKFIIQKELSSSIDNNIYKNIFTYKNI